MPPLSRQNARFLMGALAHGMDFDDALPLFQQFAAQRQANKERRREEEKELQDMTGRLAYQAGQWLMEGQDPELVRSTVAAMASANNLDASEVSRLSDLLGGIEGGPTGPSPEAVAGFQERVQPFLEKFLKAEDFQGADGLPNRQKLRMAAEQQFPEFAGDDDFDTLLDQWYADKAVPVDRWDEFQEKLAGVEPSGPGVGSRAGGAVSDLAGLGLLGVGAAGAGGMVARAAGYNAPRVWMDRKSATKPTLLKSAIGRGAQRVAARPKAWGDLAEHVGRVGTKGGRLLSSAGIDDLAAAAMPPQAAKNIFGSAIGGASFTPGAPLSIDTLPQWMQPEDISKFKPV